MTDILPTDGRRVALIKSLETNNRFYALVDESSGIRNADAVDRIPDNLLVGIAYPCLEDGLNDFAVIRTTFETIDLFPADDPIREEMMEIVNDARGNLLRRLTELHDKIHTGHAHFLGTDYVEFKDYSLAMVNKGYPRRNLDSMMKLNVFSSVAEAEGHADPSSLLFFFEFGYIEGAFAAQQEPREFIVTLFEEVIRSVKDNRNYATKYLFDRNVFQKFIAVMFVNYATTDPMFYGINKKDYGVSGDRDMELTPLYVAIRKELVEIEQRHKRDGTLLTPRRTDQTAGVTPIEPIVSKSEPIAAEPDFSNAFIFSNPVEGIAENTEHAGRISFEQAASMLPAELVNSEILLNPITSLCSAAHLLEKHFDPEVQKYARIVLLDASRLVNEMKRLGIISEIANDPSQLT